MIQAQLDKAAEKKLIANLVKDSLQYEEEFEIVIEKIVNIFRNSGFESHEYDCLAAALGNMANLLTHESEILDED